MVETSCALCGRSMGGARCSDCGWEVGSLPGSQLHPPVPPQDEQARREYSKISNGTSDPGRAQPVQAGSAEGPRQPGPAHPVASRPPGGALLLGLGLIVAAVVVIGSVAAGTGGAGRQAANQASQSSELPSPTAGVDETSEEPQVSAGEWLLILASVAKADEPRSVAEAKATRLAAKSGRRVVVLDSNLVNGLNPGYWAVVVPGFSSKGAAGRACESFGRALGGDCYPRKVQ